MFRKNYLTKYKAKRIEICSNSELTFDLVRKIGNIVLKMTGENEPIYSISEKLRKEYGINLIFIEKRKRILRIAIS